MSFVQSLIRISEVIQVPLTWDGSSVSGGASGVVSSVTPGLNIPVKITPESFFSGAQVGVVFSIVGDLGMLVSVYPKTGVVSAYLIDKSKAPPLDSCVSKSMNLLDALSSIGKKAIVASFFYSDRWKKMTLPS